MAKEQIRTSLMLFFVALLFDANVVAAVPAKPLTVPRSNIGSVPPAPNRYPALRELQDQVIQDGIGTPCTGHINICAIHLHSQNHSSNNLEQPFWRRPTAIGDPFDVFATPTSDDFSFFPRGVPTTTPSPASGPQIDPRSGPFTASCPRAQLYIDYCASWYAEGWSNATNQAYCLCYGPTSSSLTSEDISTADLVWIPDLFDGDASDCYGSYSGAFEYWNDVVTEYTDIEEVQDAWQEASNWAEAWGEARSFCNDAGNDLQAKTVESSYYDEPQAATTEEAESVGTLTSVSWARDSRHQSYLAGYALRLAIAFLFA